MHMESVEGDLVWGAMVRPVPREERSHGEEERGEEGEVEI